MKTEPDYFWYAGSLAELDVSASESPMQIRLNEFPPYMVAQTSLYELYCAPWGHDVWKVKVLEIGDMSNIRADCGYLRAKVIEKIECIDRGLLFGSHGSGVVAILDHIAQLSLEQVAFLATCSTKGVPQQAIKNQVIHRWCKDYAPNRYPPESYDWTNILQIPDTREEMGSPVAQGLIILHDLWRQLAKRLVGDAAWEIAPLSVDEEEEPSVCWTPMWLDAYHQVESAVLSYSHLDYATPEERQLLSQGWNECLRICPVV